MDNKINKRWIKIIIIIKWQLRIIFINKNEKKMCRVFINKMEKVKRMKVRGA